MPLNYNDLTTRGWKRYHAAASANAVLTVPVRIMAIVLTSTGATGTASIFNAATATGGDVIALAAGTNASAILNLSQSGTTFDVGVSTTLGATTTIDIFYLDA